MARIGSRQAERTHSGLIEQRQERFQLNIVYVRTVPVSPTDMKPDSIGRNVDQSPVERFDVKLDSIEEVLKRPIDEHDLPFQRQVWRVELKHVSTADDKFVLLAQFIGEREQIIAVARVRRSFPRAQ